MKRKLLLTALLTICATIFSQNISIDVDSSYISVGEWTTFTVTASGDFDNIRYSEPKDITMTQIGKSSSFTIINGKKTRSYNLKFRVKALKEGNLALPIFYTEDRSGNKIYSEEKILYVTKLEESLIQNHDVNSTFETPYVKLYLEVPNRNFYVGEAIPVKVIAYFSTRYQPGIDRSPYIKTGSFLLDSSEKYNNNLPEVVINGEKWLQISWDSYLTPLKSGELEIEIAIESYIEKPSGNSGFFTSTDREQIKTSSTLKNLKINPLPLENRPESFTGAIGDFSLNSAVDITKGKVGDPLTLTIDIFGSGNFQRISMPNLEEDDNQWKLYPESSSFNGSNGSNYKGVKTFQQILSPQNSDIKRLPIFNFSFFNPIEEKYIELSTESVDLKITPGEFQDRKSNDLLDTRFIEKKESMRHLKKQNSSNYNHVKNSNYLIVSILLSLLFFILSICLILLKYRKDNRVENSDKKIRLILKQIDKEEHEGELYKALQLYRDLIRTEISNSNRINEMSITSSDIENNKLKMIFTTLDELNYTNRELKIEEYKKLTKDLLKELKC